MRLAWVGSICWSGGRRGSGLYIVASQGASPSGRLIVPEGREGRPALEPGRMLCVPERSRDLAALEEPGRLVEVLRALPRDPEVGVDLVGTRAFCGELECGCAFSGELLM